MELYWEALNQPWPRTLAGGWIGAVVGSFLNVVVARGPARLAWYRAGRPDPAPLDLVLTPSRCPKCATAIAWHDNVPVLGWLWLRGKCRACKLPISVRYPLIEAWMMGAFAATFLACGIGLLTLVVCAVISVLTVAVSLRRSK